MQSADGFLWVELEVGRCRQIVLLILLVVFHVLIGVSLVFAQQETGSRELYDYTMSLALERAETDFDLDLNLSGTLDTSSDVSGTIDFYMLGWQMNILDHFSVGFDGGVGRTDLGLVHVNNENFDTKSDIGLSGGLKIGFMPYTSDGATPFIIADYRNLSADSHGGSGEHDLDRYSVNAGIKYFGEFYSLAGGVRYLQNELVITGTGQSGSDVTLDAESSDNIGFFSRGAVPFSEEFLLSAEGRFISELSLMVMLSYRFESPFRRLEAKSEPVKKKLPSTKSEPVTEQDGPDKTVTDNLPDLPGAPRDPVREKSQPSPSVREVMVWPMLLKKGKNHYSSGRYGQALQFFKRVRDHRPEFVKNLLWLADTYSQLGKTQEAITIHQKVLEIDPDNIRARSTLPALQSNYTDTGVGR